MRPTTKRTACGFTLAEVLIAMALLAMVMVAAALAIQAAQVSHAYNAEKNELIARTRGVLDRIVQDIHRATSFQVIDAQTLAVTLNDGSIHTYYWDGSHRGNLTYTETPLGGVESPPAVMTGFIDAFSVAEDGVACRVQITVAGNVATCQNSITATPGKIIY